MISLGELEACRGDKEMTVANEEAKCQEIECGTYKGLLIKWNHLDERQGDKEYSIGAKTEDKT